MLYALDGVTEAAVVGVPDPILGQAIKAFVVANGNWTETGLLLHCKTHLEDFMVPQQIELVESLPKTSSGKIQKSEIADSGQSGSMTSVWHCRDRGCRPRGGRSR